ncbi:hypothetical protein CMT42_15360 [Elizabethkingia anophelis]|nr:hypothetical protein [Elizabethkingia anophelis]AQX52544.1 hypothetical protein AYC66_18480 [Elizabethkingia anophelis]MDV3551062.1 hypothetical protein [Elizabethkingia anophelis]MDV3570110.1 hypothetical protein [Elizabethkingia anophelis]MDV3704748.1 hypothetical protein [Elizabethkingia anophelis]MDV3917904.1 hypothetical protein [Elizabethkingia anophelis]
MYCFSILNNPKRKADIKKILSVLKNHKTRNDITCFFLREKYPVLISNNVDPFSKNNHELTNQILDVLIDLNIPVQINTRGGYGWQEASEKLKPSLWYVSVPYSDDEVRKLYEPAAPSLDERFDMVKEIMKKHKVMIGINPFDVQFSENHKKIIDQYSEIGIKYFWVNAFHLNYKQQANLTDRQKEILGEDLLTRGAKKEFPTETIELYLAIKAYAEEKGCTIVGTPSGHYEPYFEDLYSVYPKTMPTQNDFFKWCEENKKEGDFISFSEFYDFFAPLLPVIEGNISSYIYNKSNLDDKTYNKKMRLTNVLHPYWDSKAGLNLAKYYPVFSWVKKQTERKLDWVKDPDGDRMLMYHPNNYNTKEYLILE